MEALKERMKKIREQYNLSQKQMAKDLAIPETAISKYENGVVKPTSKILSNIGIIYRINLNWLLNGDGEMFISQTVTNVNNDDVKITFVDHKAIHTEGYLTEDKDYRDYLVFKKRYIKNVIKADPDNVSFIMAYNINNKEAEKWISQGDLVMYDKSQNKPFKEGIYLISFAPDYVIAKVKIIDNQILIIADEDIKTSSIMIDLDNSLGVKILGKIVWCGKKIQTDF